MVTRQFAAIVTVHCITIQHGNLNGYTAQLAPIAHIGKLSRLNVSSLQSSAVYASTEQSAEAMQKPAVQRGQSKVLKALH